MRFIEMFAGIGGMGHGLMEAGMECVGFAEFDKFAHQAYNILHNQDNRMWRRGNVRYVSNRSLRKLRRKRGEIHLLAAGFPCQSFSISGKRKGFKDRTRGTLFFEILRWASVLKPKRILLENVDGLLSHDGGRTFAVILCSLDELGYDAEWCVLNSASLVPQNRERVFVKASLRGTGGREVFPFGAESRNAVKVVGRVELNADDYCKRVYSIDGLSPCLPTMQGGSQEPKIYDGERVRKLTPLECFRLQSYPDEWYYTLKEHGFSDSQLYKMAGNGVTSVLAKEIGVRLMSA